MTFNRSNKRTSREAKLDLESLGERIAPAVYHPGAKFLVELRHDELIAKDRLDKTVNRLPKGPIVVSAPIMYPMLNLVVENNVSVNAKVPLVNKLPVSKLPLNPPPPVPLTNTVLLPPVPPAPTSITLPANVSSILNTVYKEYEQDPGAFTGDTTSTNGENLALVEGNQVGIDIHDTNPSEFENLLTELANAGMTITISSAGSDTAVGMLPIADLPTVAALSPTISINPEMPATLH